MRVDWPGWPCCRHVLINKVFAVALALATLTPSVHSATTISATTRRQNATRDKVHQMALLRDLRPLAAQTSAQLARRSLAPSTAYATAATGTAEPRALGAYIPGAPWNPTAIGDFTRMVGAPPAIVMWYQDWARPSDNAFAPAAMNAVVARAATPMVTWEPWDPSLGTATQPSFALHTIVAGDHDAYIHQFARAAAVWGQPFYLRFAHEMNGNWYPWSPGINGNSSVDFVAAWQHVVDIFRQEGATNARWVWSPNIEYDGSTPFTAVYPGDAYVDAVALDGYNWGSSQPGKSWQSFATVFGQSYADITTLTSKPLMIAETASAEAGGDKATWITQGLLSDIPQLFPRVNAIIWFDENKETNWLVNSSPASLAAYQQVAASPMYASGTATSTPSTNSPPPVSPTATSTSIPPTVTPQAQTVFATGFETGDKQPTWYDTMDWGTNVTGVCCNLKFPETSPRQEIAHTGTMALMYSGLATSTDQDFSYNKIFDLHDKHITVGPSTTLSYWIYPQSNSLTYGANSTYVALDLLFTDGSAPRDSGAVDQYGVRLHPHYQGQGAHLALNRWNFVTSTIGAQNAGKTIDRLLVGYDQPGVTGGYRGYIDDIAITN